jgi:hypothetical protein
LVTFCSVITRVLPSRGEGSEAVRKPDGGTEAGG